MHNQDYEYVRYMLPLSVFTVWLPTSTARAKNNLGLAGHVPRPALGYATGA